MSIIQTDHDIVSDGQGNVLSDTVVLRDVTESTNRKALEAAFLTFIDGANVAIANMQAIQAVPQVAFTNIAGAQTAARAEQDRVKQIAQTTEAHIRKTVALARYVSNQLDTLENT